jgi:hypothetical protein
MDKMKAFICGDVWLSSTLIKHKDELKYLKRSFVDHEVFICNLEAPQKTNHKREGRRALLYTDLRLLENLKIAKTNVLLLGNNHINDYGSEGLLGIVEECKKKGFHIVGAGANLAEACTPVIANVGNRRIGIFSFADTSPWVGSIPATRGRPGIAPLDVDLIERTISRVASRVDDIWVFLHWGKEFVRIPQPEQKFIAKRLVKSGATLIVGHHQHVALGYEKISKTPVYYGLGNFIFPNIQLQDGEVLDWKKAERFSIGVSGVFDSGGWRFSVDSFLVNKKGIPCSVDGKYFRLKILWLRLLTGLASVASLYRVVCLGEMFRLYLRKLLNPRRLLKSLVWRVKLRNKSMER